MEDPKTDVAIGATSNDMSKPPQALVPIGFALGNPLWAFGKAGFSAAGSGGED